MLNKRKAVPLLAIGLAVVVGCGTAEALSSEARVQAAQATERLETAYDGIETSVARGDSLLRSTTTADVADATTLSDLDMALHQAHAALDEGVRDSGGTSIFDWASMSSDASYNQETANAVSSASTSLMSAIKAVRASIALEESITAQADLSTQLDEARLVYEQNNGKVSDASTVTALSDAIGSAEQTAALDVNVTAASIYQDATNSLSVACEKVESSHTDWQAAQESAAAAAGRASAARYSSQSEAQAAAKSGGSVAQASDGTWYVTYATGQYVDSSGGVTEYFDNYYVAHRSTGTNGQTIASRPTYVVVDGVTYRYVSELLRPIGSSYSDIQSWATANGGIAFQTCDYSTGQKMALIIHYKPV